MNGSGPGSARSVSPGSTFAPSSGFTGLPEVIPPGHTEHATPVGAPILTPEQQKYAATDVLHLHELKSKLDALLGREKRTELAQACFNFLPYRAQLDLMAGENFDILSYNSDDKI